MVPLGSPGGAVIVACRSVITSILITLLLTVDEQTLEYAFLLSVVAYGVHKCFALDG